MKKPYLQNRETVRWYQSWSVILMLLALAALFSPVRPYLSQTVLAVAQPFWATGKFLGAVYNSFSIGIKGTKTLADENQALRSRQTILEEQLHMVTLLANENNDLKALLSRVTDTTFASTTSDTLCAPGDHAIGAIVLSAPRESYYSSMIIDVGSRDMVLPGDMVYSFGGTVLGEVRDVYTTTARVILYSAAQVSTTVFLGPTHVSVTVVGDGDGTFIAKLPRDVAVKIGDEASLPSVRPTLLAFVQSIKKDEANPFQTIYFKSPVNFRSLKWVYVNRTSRLVTSPRCLRVTS